MIEPLTFRPAATKLMNLIASSIAKEPYELDGFLWCQMRNEDRWKALEISRATYFRLIGKPPGNFPFVSTTREIGEARRRTTLLRVGEPRPKTERDYARMMVAVWRKWLEKNLPLHRAALVERRAQLQMRVKTVNDPDAKEEAERKLARVEKALKRMRQARETPNEFGQFIGLAKAWPDGLQVELFRMVLDDLTAFMSDVRTRQALEEAEGKPVLKPRFLRYPHIKTILDYNSVALEMMLMHYQKTGKEPPEQLKALNPALWKLAKPKP
jgi:hypothetical protein